MDNTRLDSGRPARGPTDPVGEVRAIGDYRILRRLGEGGMGAVYLGFNEKDGLQVAVKVLNEQLAADQSFIDRFYREAKSGALLNHPNIVRSFAAGRDEATGKHYLVLEYVDGPGVHMLLSRDGRLPVGDAVHVVLNVARGLEHAHSRNLIHRDIKPDNILLTRSGVAKLVDLGLAKRTDEASHLTGARQSFGTTPYMPYEQALRAKDADGRSDIYALGATLYHLVTGSVPFPADSHVEVVERKERGDYAPASTLNPEVPPALDAIIDRMLARRPRDRYQTVSELIVELERSHLAAAVPTFADPESARQDAWVQARLNEHAEPTRLDPESPARRPADAWVVRYRNRAGLVRKARATTAQLVARLTDGRLPVGVQVSRATAADFHPPSFYAEFRIAAQTFRARRKARRSVFGLKRDQPPPDPPVAGLALLARRLPLVLTVGGLMAVVLGLLTLLYYYLA